MKDWAHEDLWIVQIKTVKHGNMSRQNFCSLCRVNAENRPKSNGCESRGVASLGYSAVNKRKLPVETPPKCTLSRHCYAIADQKKCTSRDVQEPRYTSKVHRRSQGCKPGNLGGRRLKVSGTKNARKCSRESQTSRASSDNGARSKPATGRGVKSKDERRKIDASSFVGYWEERTSDERRRRGSMKRKQKSVGN